MNQHVATTKDAKLLEDAQAFYDAEFGPELERLLDQADSGDNDAQATLEAKVLDISKKVTHYVTIASGSPTARLVVEADEYSNVLNAWLEYQDLFKPWTPAPKQDQELVMRLASAVGYYGE